MKIRKGKQAHYKTKIHKINKITNNITRHNPYNTPYQQRTNNPNTPTPTKFKNLLYPFYIKIHLTLQTQYTPYTINSILPKHKATRPHSSKDNYKYHILCTYRQCTQTKNHTLYMLKSNTQTKYHTHQKTKSHPQHICHNKIEIHQKHNQHDRMHPIYKAQPKHILHIQTFRKHYNHHNQLSHHIQIHIPEN